MDIKRYLQKYIKIKNDGVFEMCNPFAIYRIQIYNISLLQGIVTMHVKIKKYPKERCPQCHTYYKTWEGLKRGLCMDCGRVNELLR